MADDPRFGRFRARTIYAPDGPTVDESTGGFGRKSRRVSKDERLLAMSETLHFSQASQVPASRLHAA